MFLFKVANSTYDKAEYESVQPLARIILRQTNLEIKVAYHYDGLMIK